MTGLIIFTKYKSYNHEYLHISVLKAVENAGIRFMRGSEEYNALVEKEIKKTRLAKIIRVSLNDNLITLSREKNGLLSWRRGCYKRYR